MSLRDFQARRTYDTDKGEGYLAVYEGILDPLQGKSIALLELGINRGGSLKLWSEYLPNARVFGLDLEPPTVDWPHNVQVAAGNQASRRDLDAAMTSWGCDRFDVIIDDASHYGDLTAASFAHLFQSHLKPGGVYVLEDWGTGYWPNWPDGRAPVQPAGDLRRFENDKVGPPYGRWSRKREIASHQAGMVGFVKLLIDVLATPDIVPHNPGAMASREEIAAIDVRPGIVVVRKAG